MNKKIWMKVLLPLLPAISVLLATPDTSVTVYDAAAGTVQTFSYFSVLPVENLQICTVLAALLAIAALVMALIYVVLGKRWCIQGVFYTACASACMSACPTLVRGDVVVVPNVLFSVLMGVAWGLAYIARKSHVEKEPEPIRLGIRK